MLATSQIGDTPVEQRIRALFEAGAVIAGHLGRRLGDERHHDGGRRQRREPPHRRPAHGAGLGFVRDVIIGQHFAQRGRFRRLLGAVAHIPRVLGMGVDEDTALVVEGGAPVIGSGAVYVIDGAGVAHSNIAEARPERPLSIFDVRTHVLANGDSFDLTRRRPADAPDLEQSQALEAQGAGRNGADAED